VRPFKCLDCRSSLSYNLWSIICCTEPGLTEAVYIVYIQEHLKHVNCKIPCTYWHRLETMNDRKQTRLLVGEGTRTGQYCNCQTVNKHRGSTTRHTDWPSVAKWLWLWPVVSFNPAEAAYRRILNEHSSGRHLPALARLLQADGHRARQLLGRSSNLLQTAHRATICTMKNRKVVLPSIWIVVGHYKQITILILLQVNSMKKIVFFWNVIRRGSCKNRHFRGRYRLHHQGERNRC
jgi:hypothetical protein